VRKDVVEVDVDKLKQELHVKDEDIQKLDQYVREAGAQMKLRKELWFGFSLSRSSFFPRWLLMPWGHLTNGHSG